MAKTSSQAIEKAPVIAELVGTFLLTGAVLAAAFSSTPVAIPLIVGLTMTLLVLVVGPISGAHVNPAVTFGLWSIGKIDLAKAVSYWIAQFAGALLALWALSSLADQEIVNLLPPAESGRVAIAEAAGAAVFLFGLAAVLASKVKDFALAFGVGFSLFTGIIFAGTVSAGVINPAIALSLAGVGDIQWHYIVGPLVGAVIGAFGYKLLSQTK